MIPLGLRGGLRHLTTLPLPYHEAESAAAPARALPWFPVVGLAVGGGVATVLALPLPVLPRAGLALAAWVALTGGLHEDGLMDCADAAFAPVSRERRLEILEDPRVGAHGATALLAGLGAAAWLARRFGGLTGDAHGAVGIIAETAALFAFLPLCGAGDAC